MATLREWITKSVQGEEVESVVFGEMGWGDYKSDEVPNYETCPKGKRLSLEEASPWLDYEFNSGYGAPGCQAIYVWTKSFVFFVSQYDGATGPNIIPRHPVDVMPDMPGG